MKGRVGLLLVPVFAATVLAWSRPSFAVDMKFAEETFKTLCSMCHGPDGHGDGPAGASLDPKPRNFHDCALMAKEPDERVFKTIKEGGPAGLGRPSAMPAWGQALDDDQIKSMIAWVRHYCK